MVLLNEIVARLDHYIILVAKNCGNPVGNPLLHQVDVDLLDVNFLVELRWELRRLEALLVDTERYFRRINNNAQSNARMQ